MAGVRSKPQPNGKYVGWFMDMNGKQKFFVGTATKTKTEQMAARLEDEHRQVRLGYRPAPKTADKHKARPIGEVFQEYLAWGRSQGGVHGRAWAAAHGEKVERILSWWKARLSLSVLSDVDDILPLTETALRELQEKGFAPLTLCNYQKALHSFCHWCEKRKYLTEDPMRGAAGFGQDRKGKRRALTPEEIARLLAVAAPERRLVYAVALGSGLRASELKALRVKDLDMVGKGLRLDPEWTKNRKPGFQQLPGELVEELAASCRNKPDDTPLLAAPDGAHASRMLRKDLDAAKIPRWTPEGKADFHSLRGTFATLVLESGANAKEAMTLLRHATPDLTLRLYAKARESRLTELAERIGNTLKQKPTMQNVELPLAAGAEGMSVTPSPAKALEQTDKADWRERVGIEPTWDLIRAPHSV